MTCTHMCYTHTVSASPLLGDSGFVSTHCMFALGSQCHPRLCRLSPSKLSISAATENWEVWRGEERKTDLPNHRMITDEELPSWRKKYLKTRHQIRLSYCSPRVEASVRKTLWGPIASSKQPVQEQREPDDLLEIL